MTKRRNCARFFFFLCEPHECVEPGDLKKGREKGLDRFPLSMAPHDIFDSFARIALPCVPLSLYQTINFIPYFVL